MTTLNATQVLEQLDVFRIRCQSTTGLRHLTPSDYAVLGMNQMDNVPREIATEKQLKTISPEILKGPERFKKQMDRLMRAAGISMLDGALYGITKADSASVQDELTKIIRDAENWLTGDLPLVFDQHQQEWWERWPRYAGLMRAKAPSLREFQTRVVWKFRMIAIGAHADRPEDIEEEVSDLGDRLLDGIATVANGFYALAEKKTEKTLGRASTVRFLREVLKKLKSFAFLDARVHPTIKAIEEMLTAIPAEGASLEGATYWQAQALILRLCDPDKVRNAEKEKLVVPAGPVTLDLFANLASEPAEEEVADEEEREPEVMMPVPPAPTPTPTAKPAFVMF
ncbi:MAG: hypothetical protein HQL38_01585 [Alphaproteobacteria bacterium]|nr:hypothetical protein [Alphaproteobacteria bacterium]